MRVIRGLHNAAPADRGAVLALGNFDGVHRGHQALIDQLRELARGSGAQTSVMCFEPQPLEFLQPEAAPRRLQDLAEKLRCLRAAAVDQVVVLPFNAALAATRAENFVQEILIDALGIRALLAGADCRFGHRRRGDIDLLRRMAARGGYQLEVLPTVTAGAERVSSTRIRAALAGGELSQANALLGREFALQGRVVHGQKLGRQLGAPTANIRLRRPSPLRHGVYAVRLDGAPAVANIGLRPTVGGQGEHLEVHLLEGSPELYDRVVRIRFETFLRSEERFPDLTALQAAIAGDIRAARAWFEKDNH